MRRSRRVPHVTATVAGAEFDGFYAAHFGDTVAMTYRLTADIDEAQDITQEAFCRAWRRWQHLSDYDNPISWVRRVATNLAYSRWRHLRVAAAHLAQHRADEMTVTPPNLNHITIVEGLRKIPRDQCVALVLHHMLDLPISEIADALDVPAGRVKMWLHRGRQTLSIEILEDVKGNEGGETPAVDNTAPGNQRTKHRQGRKGRPRTYKAAVKAAAVVLTILAAITATSAAQSLRRVSPSTKELAERPVRSSPVMRPAVAVSRDGDQLTVRWTDPSSGHAQPILIGGPKDEQPQQLAAPAQGDTKAIITGFSPTATYCFTVVLVNIDNSYLPSDQVCTRQSPTSRGGRFEALATL